MEGGMSDGGGGQVIFSNLISETIKGLWPLDP